MTLIPHPKDDLSRLRRTVACGGENARCWKLQIAKVRRCDTPLFATRVCARRWHRPRRNSQPRVFFGFYSCIRRIGASRVDKIALTIGVPTAAATFPVQVDWPKAQGRRLFTSRPEDWLYREQVTGHLRLGQSFYLRTPNSSTLDHSVMTRSRRCSSISDLTEILPTERLTVSVSAGD